MSTAIRQSTWLYPFIEIIHIFGIVLVAGAAVLFDLQLLTTPRRSSSHFNFNLLTWSKRGLLLAIPSGIFLFITNAVALSQDPVLWLKFSLLALAALNAWIFHVRVYLPIFRQDLAAFGRNRGTFNAVFSIVLWMSIIACGRLLAY